MKNLRKSKHLYVACNETTVRLKFVFHNPKMTQIDPKSSKVDRLLIADQKSEFRGTGLCKLEISRRDGGNRAKPKRV